MTVGRAEEEDGFVLLETLVAFLVLSVALAAAISAVSQATLAIRRAGDASHAALVAREIAAVQGRALTASETTSGQTAGSAAWRMVAQELPDENTIPLFAVTIEVWPSAASKPYVFRSFATGEAEP